MNYLKIYESIIQKSVLAKRYRVKKDDKNYVYYENHHIIPRCLLGTDKKENLVLLTPKEHYVCHKLLTHIHSNNISLIYAFYMMSHFKRYKTFISSRDYTYIRNLISSTPITDENRNNLKLGVKKRKPISEETRKKMSDAKKGKISHNKGKHPSKEICEKMKISQIKREPFSEETRKKMSDAKKGVEIGKGRKLSSKHRKNISNYRKGKPANNKGKVAIYENNKKKFIDKVMNI